MNLIFSKKNLIINNSHLYIYSGQVWIFFRVLFIYCLFLIKLQLACFVFIHVPIFNSKHSSFVGKWFHSHLPSKAMLKLLMSFMPNPPFSFGKHTVSQLIHAILVWSGPPPHRNLRCILTSLSTTDLGTLSPLLGKNSAVGYHWLEPRWTPISSIPQSI